MVEDRVIVGAHVPLCSHAIELGQRSEANGGAYADPLLPLLLLSLAVRALLAHKDGVPKDAICISCFLLYY